MLYNVMDFLSHFPPHIKTKENRKVRQNLTQEGQLTNKNPEIEAYDKSSQWIIRK